MANLMKKISNEQIFTEILETGFITKSQIQLLKNRSNKEGYDLFDYSIFDKLDEIKITPEQGEQGLTWLKRFLKCRKNVVYGYREIEIIKNATPSDFTFKGFYNAGRYGFVNYVPYYEVGGMEYVPLAEPYIIG